MLHTIMLTATPHVRRVDAWSQLQAGGDRYVVTCWHPGHGAFDIGIFATSKGNALVVASDTLRGTGSVANYAVAGA
jgi:hypothetical protein